MYKYKTEILTVGTKWFSDKANSDDIAKLDELLNQGHLRDGNWSPMIIWRHQHR